MKDAEIEKIRLGVILPSVNTVVEPWFSKILPENASLHASRMFLSANLCTESLIEMDRRDGVAAALQLKSCKPKVIAYCCTASSIVQGQEYDQHLMAEYRELPMVMGSLRRSLTCALRSGARRHLPRTYRNRHFPTACRERTSYPAAFVRTSASSASLPFGCANTTSSPVCGSPR